MKGTEAVFQSAVCLLLANLHAALASRSAFMDRTRPLGALSVPQIVALWQNPNGNPNGNLSMRKEAVYVHCLYF